MTHLGHHATRLTSLNNETMQVRGSPESPELMLAMTVAAECWAAEHG